MAKGNTFTLQYRFKTAESLAFECAPGWVLTKVLWYHFKSLQLDQKLRSCDESTFTFY